MKTLLACVPVLCLIPFASSLRAAVPQDALEARVAALEGELAALKKQNEEAHALVEQSIKYQNAQAAAAGTLLDVLTRSEEAGFTKGINFQSREILLAGLRAYWGGASKDLPKLPEKPREEARTPVRGARGARQ
jgi:hypothetical protein